MDKYFVLTLIIVSAPAFAFADSQTSIIGSEQKIIEIQPETNTGLNNIFIVYDTKDCSIKFNTSDGYTSKVYRYSNLGGGYAEEITDALRDVSSVTIGLSNQDMGYILEDGSNRYYCWVVNYAIHRMTLQGAMVSSEQQCDYSIIEVEGTASPITFYTINGQPRTLSREIYIDYDTQEFNEESQGYSTVSTRKVLEGFSGKAVSISPPAYCSTYFHISGDRFLRYWNMEVSTETGIASPYAVECKTDAIQEMTGTEEEPSNIIKGDDSGLGGSAPATITFLAYTTEGVLHYEWQMSRNADFETLDYRFYQKDLDYTFTEEGSFYLRFIGSNSDGTCETFGDVYTVSIGASALECPNAFSPNGDGVNDIWKVSYRSILDFHCEIFNRNGQRVFGFDDPSQGWDGTWHGKMVRPGVYYYVITATGADGQTYKKSGDINIINSVNYGTGSGDSSNPLD